jgi:AcrR family transcriptional regulator
MLKTMSPETEPDTRTEILRVAQAEFERRGYHATSLRVIAARVGISKAAVLYHFPEKAEILAALAAPMLDDLERVIAAAEQKPDAEARWVVIEGVLDAELRHRHLLRMNLRDLALSAARPIFERFRDAMLRGNALVAGRGASFSTRVRAAQALAMLGDPVVLFADAPVDELRAEILVGVRALLGEPERRAPPQRRRRGRPSVLDAASAERAQRMAAEGRSIDDIAAALGVSRATLYRRLNRLFVRQL